MNQQEIEHYMVKERGFEVIGTGGNCEAFRADIDDDGKYHVLIAQECSLPIDDGEKDRDICIMLFDETGEYVEDIRGETAECTGSLRECIHFYEYIASEIIAEIEGES